MTLKHTRVAIVGTAPSWQMVPWTDSGLFITSLNDAYSLPGFQRADRWYDLHPLNKFFHPAPNKPLMAHEVPAGMYVRPEHHLAWLGKQVIPVVLHPDFATQHPDAATWAHATPFPRQAVEAAFGRYMTSSPSWMLGQMILEGASDFSIYGIHLATEHEYLEQRPCFEYLLGRVLGAAKVTITVKDGMRHYETRDGHVALPEMSPVLQAGWQYGFDVRPAAHAEPIRWELHKVQVKQQRLLEALRQRPWYQPWACVQEPGSSSGVLTIRRALPSTLNDELYQLQAEQQDWSHVMTRMHLAAQQAGVF